MSAARAAPQGPGTPLPAEQLQAVAAVFGMLAATVRLQILWLLAAGPRDVGTLAAELDQSVQTVSHHLAKLRLGGLVHARRDGKRQIYDVADESVIDLIRLAAAPYTDDPADGRPRRRTTA
ncbi:metalloregulator ArsR/SmtB family transcription factor [Pseudonocardia sp. RS11V-5]|uniref:ArsR/SmtB family transcription factor n=1 Tax=Pseudonocardia terrae TaxID=2905831 RepID=UPI001E377D6B|nr:metalloregulator ArsR/SmtB family transcription factor [Pseudonocardia terrae]MCE3554078.1 metalloregulator ArsR/SmtB family transcription factor [Pseudonocardia terrae]